ncbi:hypothetical protein WJX73_009791 [Symbiochloris irregularis]|uniref:Riboflavin biosynthesis protein PYRD, chloroplastic n=1 Tax=Symbiochloris irregularis TaxID=706552 RepID=A0AAW1P0T9_9CHLO
MHPSHAVTGLALEARYVSRPANAALIRLSKFRNPSLRAQKAPGAARRPARCRSGNAARALVATDHDRAYMRQALDLAKKALGQTEPNPAVGCVIVRGGEVVGEGFHPKAGKPHAEVYALRAAGETARGATAYVTLEPCNHFGRTPPCSQALVDAAVTKVVIGIGDPNPLVSGSGAMTLRDAGIEVVFIGGRIV